MKKLDELLAFTGVLVAMLALLIAGFYIGYKARQGDALRGDWRYELVDTVNVVKIKR